MTFLRLLTGLVVLVLLAMFPALAQPELPAAPEARFPAFSPDGKLLVVARGTAKNGFRATRYEILEAVSGQRRHSLQCKPEIITFFAFSSDSTKLMSCGMEPGQPEESRTNIVLWDVQSGQQICQLETATGQYPMMPVFSPDGTLVVASVFDISRRPFTSRLRVWDARTGQLKQDKTDFGGELSQVLFTPDGRFIIVVVSRRTDGGNAASELLFLEPGSLRTVHTLAVDSDNRSFFLLSPDGQSLARCYLLPGVGQTNELHLDLMPLGREADSARLPLELETNQVILSAFTFAPAGNRFLALVAFTEQQRPLELWCWDTRSGRRLTALSLDALDMTKATHGAISPDAQTMALARGNTVQLRRTSDGELLKEF